MRTVLVFLDLPVHFELRAEPMPLMSEGQVIEFDGIRIRDPGGSGRSKTVSGPYVVERSKCVYSSRRPSVQGLTQYLEMRPTA